MAKRLNKWFRDVFRIENAITTFKGILASIFTALILSGSIFLSTWLFTLAGTEMDTFAWALSGITFVLYLFVWGWTFEKIGK